MIISLLIIIKFPKIGLKDKTASNKKKNTGHIALFISTFITGFIGGLGILKYIIIAYFFETTYIKANASQRIPWVISVIITTIFLIIKGFVIIPLGLALFIGYFIGGHIGALTEIKKGDKWVRIFFIVIICLSIVKYLFF